MISGKVQEELHPQDIYSSTNQTKVEKVDKILWEDNPKTTCTSSDYVEQLCTV